MYKNASFFRKKKQISKKNYTKFPTRIISLDLESSRLSSFYQVPNLHTF